jgi:hypothetical protein
MACAAAGRTTKKAAFRTAISRCKFWTVSYSALRAGDGVEWDDQTITVPASYITWPCCFLFISMLFKMQIEVQRSASCATVPTHSVPICEGMPFL